MNPELIAMLDALPPGWRAEIENQIATQGLEATIKANRDWATANPTDPGSAGLLQWVNAASNPASAGATPATGTGSTTGTTGTTTPPATGTAAENTAVPASGTSWNTLLPGGGQAPTPTVGGGNYNQTQNSAQGGAFNTVGSTTQNQSGTSGQSNTGTQTSTQTGTTTGTSTTGVTDTLGFGQLLKDQATGAAATDAARSAFLTDVMNTGGTQFGSQVDQAVRQALSGPRMTGAGQSAQARSAGYAASDIGRNNLTQRIGAAGQLAGPTAVSTLANAGTPFLGSTQSNTGTSSMENLVNTVQNSTGWQNLINKTNESQAGTSAAASSQSGAGNIPQGQPVKTGGCVLCTAATELGLERNHRVLRKVIAYKLGPGWKKFRLAARGYFAVFGPFADYLLDRPMLAKVLYPLARKVVYEELRVSGRRLPFRLSAWLTHWIGDGFCRLVGLLPVSGYVKQQRILDIAKRHNILFEVQS